MCNLKIILKYIGIVPLLQVDTFPNYKHKYKNIFLHIINYSYTFFIFSLLLYQPLLESILTYKTNDISNISNIIFYYIAPIHFYIAFYYFRNQEEIRIYESKKLDSITNETCVLKCIPEEKTLLKSLYIVSFLVIIESLITLYIEDPSIYDNMSLLFYNISKIIISISFIPSRIILVLNSHIFFFSFLQQIHKLQDLEKTLQYRNFKEQKKYSVAVLCYEIIDIRYTLSRLIQKTELMYIATTTLGGVSTGLSIELKHWGIRNITSIVLFIFSQIIYLWIIYLIDTSRDEIGKIIHRRSFASKYILRKNNFMNTCFDIEKNIIELQNSNEYQEKKSISGDSNDIIIHTQDNSLNIRKRNIENEIKEIKEYENKEDNNTYIDIKNNTEIQGYLEDSNEIKKKIHKLMQTKNDSICLDKSHYLQTDDYIRCIYEWVTNTGSSVDWIIVNQLLHENWACFKLLGFQFTNGKALSNAIFITSLLVASTSLLGKVSSTLNIF